MKVGREVAAVGPEKPYWVTFSGALMDDGEMVDNRSFEAQEFVKALTKCLVGSERTTSPAILTYGDGSVVLTAVVAAGSEGTAVDTARAAFAVAITAAGGSSKFPDGEHPSWTVARLLRKATVEPVDPTCDETPATTRSA